MREGKERTMLKIHLKYQGDLANEGEAGGQPEKAIRITAQSIQRSQGEGV